MSSGAGNGSPKTLADVSHLFFSSTSDEGEGAQDGVPDGAELAGPAPHGDSGHAAPRDPGRWRRTRVLIVTGGDGAPGKSTVAVNVAQALMQRGRVGIFDADPRVPNARFYLGFPSWHYLSPVTGEGDPAPTALADSGLVVVDWSVASGQAAEAVGSSDVVYVDIPDAGRYPLDFAVVDLAAARIAWLRPIASRIDHAVLVARPEWAGFEEAFGVLSVLALEIGARDVGVVVNRTPDSWYAAAFHEKLAEAAECLLSVRTRLLGGVAVEPNMGSEQRERGAIVRARPDAVSALLLREVAARIVEPDGTNGPRESGRARAAGTEKSDETTDRTVSPS